MNDIKIKSITFSSPVTDKDYLDLLCIIYGKYHGIFGFGDKKDLLTHIYNKSQRINENREDTKTNLQSISKTKGEQ